MDQYQTTISRDGSIVVGTFPTIEWFKRIAQTIDFNDMSVVDYGCAEGTMSILASKAGAKNVTAIDMKLHHKENIENHGISFFCENISQISARPADVGILSMIIHWLDHHIVRELVSKIDNQVAIIYRKPNDGYFIPQNGVWFPTSNELNIFMESIGFNCLSTEILMTQDNNKQIELKTFLRYKKSKIENNNFIKYNMNRCNEKWVKRINTLSKYLDIPGTFYISGYNMPIFNKIIEFDKSKLKSLLELLKNAFSATGLMFTDITCSNVMEYNNQYYVIDYDNIGDYNTNNDKWKFICEYAGISNE